ncbi:ribosome maturation factor RimP [Corynebacterium heidelbergense]|uniref:Ribosome maturation factor RimP n=1 Tax=Corynebacterium heidelbergense TaxID=2055947 RepID=A0A364V5T2_9CORY|nr:ribosome maturation factor RimP [Corynebacterium heidelbergense]RAV32013.1 ribosome maturation factor RimP [Corynebacterium heidelbergense]
MAFPTVEDLTQHIQPLAREFGYDVEGVTITKAGAKSAVRVAVDADERPDLDGLEEFSGALSARLDAIESAGEANFGPGYTLEVTTPGVDHPLTEPRHWRRNTGRLVKLPTGQICRVAAVDQGGVVLLSAPTMGSHGAQGNKGRKGAPPTIREVGFEEVAGAVVEIEFSPAPQAEAELIGLDREEYRRRNK